MMKGIVKKIMKLINVFIINPQPQPKHQPQYIKLNSYLLPQPHQLGIRKGGGLVIWQLSNSS